MIDGEIQWCRPLVIIGFEVSSRFDKLPNYGNLPIASCTEYGSPLIVVFCLDIRTPLAKRP